RVDSPPPGSVSGQPRTLREGCDAAPEPRALRHHGAGGADLKPEPAGARPGDAPGEIPADRFLPDSALAGRRATLRPLDGIRGAPCGPPLRWGAHVRLARRPGRPAPRSPPDPPPGRSHVARCAGRSWCSRSALGAMRSVIGVRAEHFPAAGWRDAESRREVHQFGHGPRLHLRHHVPALLLDGRFGSAQLAGDLLVEETGDDPCQHIALSWGERSVPAPKLRALLTLHTDRPVALDSASNGVEHLLLAERLRQELDGARFHSPDRHGDVAVTGDED